MRMNRLEWKEKSRDYKIGYLIGCVIMFFVGLISCLLSYFYPISAIILVIPLIILKLILNKKKKKERE